MWVGVYLNEGGIEDYFKEICINDLLKGRNIKEALERMGITEKNFSRAILKVTDKDTKIKLKFVFKNYEEFVKYMWYIRVRLKKR